MEYQGNIRKMKSRMEDVVRYELPLGPHSVDMNRLIGRHLTMKYLGVIHCIRCGRKTARSFAQGFCYPCFVSAPETEECVLRPELCRAHLEEARDMEYAREHCLIEHVVYLSLTSGMKVGVTRISQVPTRWIDQGAVRAIELACTPNRYLAGLIEVALKAHIADRTHWRRMLSGPGPEGIDLREEKEKISVLVPGELAEYLSSDDEITELVYPVEHYPGKIKSLDFDRETEISGILSGIKGQYLIFRDDSVINMRKFGGYLISLRSD
jgi:hypothetical protein